MIFSLSLHSIQWLFEDEYRWTNWLAGISTDLVKIAIAGAAGYLASVGVLAIFAKAGVIAIVPLGAGVLVAVGVGFLLSAIDNHYGITEQLIHYLEKKEAEAKRSIYDGVFYVVRSASQSVQRQLSRSATRRIQELLRVNPSLW